MILDGAFRYSASTLCSASATRGPLKLEIISLKVQTGWTRLRAAWHLSSSMRGPTNAGGKELEPGKLIERREIFDNGKWRSLTHLGYFQAGVLDEGTIWGIYHQSGFGGGSPEQRKQIAPGTDWVAV